MADFDWSWYQNRAYPAQPQPQFDWDRYYSGGFQPSAPSRVDPPGAGPDRGFFGELFEDPASNIGSPPTARTVTSVPVNGSPYIPGPNAPPKTEERLQAGVYPRAPGGVPDVAVASALDVVPPGSAFPPLPRPRPIMGFPTSASLRPGALPPLPLPRPAHSPLQPVAAVSGAPIPPLPVGSARKALLEGGVPVAGNVKQAGKHGGSKGGGSSSSGSSGGAQQRFELNGKEVRPVQTSRWNASTNKFEPVTVYR